MFIPAAPTDADGVTVTDVADVTKMNPTGALC